MAVVEQTRDYALLMIRNASTSREMEIKLRNIFHDVETQTILRGWHCDYSEILEETFRRWDV